jgi:hypothetical protein
MRTALGVAGAILVAAFLGMPITSRAEQGASDASLAQALKQAQLPLERGLAASAREGTPISAKYELEDDDADELQLSVYTMKEADPNVDFETGDVTLGSPSFAEVIVDYTTAKVVKVIPIKDGEDLVAARNQSKAMANAKRSLEAATARAVSAHAGYRAVAAMPDLKDGHAVVKVVLLGGNDWMTVYETLD